MSTDHSAEEQSDLDLMRSALTEKVSEEAEDRLARMLETNPVLLKKFEDMCGLDEFSVAIRRMGEPIVPVTSSLRQAIQSMGNDGSSNVARMQTKDTKCLGFLSENITLKRELGQGATGTVYEAFDELLGRPVAVKVLSDGSVSSEIAKERLIREAQAASQLQHENVVAIHSIHPAGDRPFIVQQFVAGETLQQRLDRIGTLPEVELSSLTVQLARGLAAAHRCGLIHRDLKPENILIESKTGIVRIADFGLAKRQGTEKGSLEGLIAGTPSYMSPEQTRGESLDGRSDLFSLGVVLYQCMTGRLPFRSDDTYEVMEQIRSGTPVPTHEIVRGLSPSWSGIVERLMAKNREDRFLSADELLEVLGGNETRLPAVKPPRMDDSENLRSKAMTLVLTCSFFVIAGVAVWAYVLSRGAKAPGVGPTNSLIASTETTLKEVPDRVGFRIAGQSEQYGTLLSTIDACSDEATVILSGNGEIEIDSIEIRGKRLKIMASPGAQVKLVSKAKPFGKKEPCISTDSDLLLHGLVIDSFRSGDIELPIQTVVQSKGGLLTIDRCKITAHGVSACIVADGKISINDSRLIAPVGAAVASIHSSTTIQIVNSALEGKDGLSFLTMNPGIINSRRTEESLETVRMEQVSIKAECAIRFALLQQPVRRIPILFSKCIFDCENVVELSSLAPKRFDLSTASRLQEMLSILAEWREEKCIYRSKTRFLGSLLSRRQNKMSKAPFADLIAWEKYWGISPTTSIQMNFGDATKDSNYDTKSFPPAFIECGPLLDRLPPL